MIVPRDYQYEAVASIFRFFTAHKNVLENPIVAMPTGTGKSVVIAEFLKQAFAMYRNQRMLVATHVKELIEQDYNEIKEIWPEAPAGIYSAGLKRKEVHHPITFCGIASIIKKVEDFGKIDIMIVDECHMVGVDEESMYLKAIALLRIKNPKLRIIGLTASPWRQGVGCLTSGGIFTHICCNLIKRKAFQRFIEEGYLVPLIPMPTETFLDTTGVGMIGGDFNKGKLEKAVNKDDITIAALQETMRLAYDRKSWIVFASGVNHAIRITELLNQMGVSARCVHSKQSPGERDRNIKEWKEGKYTAIVNNGILTTGINHKPLDLIVMLRPTRSTNLWVQMLGRGTRPSAATYKENCLVLDFAQNTRNMGPVDDPVIPRKKGEPRGEVPVKQCDNCEMFNHISAKFCGGVPHKSAAGCGHEFTFKVLIKPTISALPLMGAAPELPIVVEANVDHITFDKHQKLGKPDSMKVTYYSGVNKYTEYVLFEHGGFGERKARQWWEKRTTIIPFPESTEQALSLAPGLIAPIKLRVHVNKKFNNKNYPEIISETFSEVPF